MVHKRQFTDANNNITAPVANRLFLGIKIDNIGLKINFLMAVGYKNLQKTFLSIIRVDSI